MQENNSNTSKTASPIDGETKLFNTCIEKLQTQIGYRKVSRFSFAVLSALATASTALANTTETTSNEDKILMGTIGLLAIAKTMFDHYKLQQANKLLEIFEASSNLLEKQKQKQK